MDAITYLQVGDYLLPDLKLSEEETKITLGRWGIAHKEFLKAHKKGLYSHLLLSCKLYQHCKEIEDSAKEQIYQITKQMALAENITEELKATDQMAWVGEMNSIRNRAEEIILRNLIYV
jgi:hypothetical protein